MLDTIEIFRAGSHTSSNGVERTYTPEELAATAQAYDPASFAAPVVVGHPQTDDPAYAWVRSLEYRDGTLQAHVDQVDPDFAEIVKAGRFRKVSASFYLPDSPHNPRPGTLYLKHIGFLGAAAPAVKGLKPLSLEHSEHSDETVVFETATETDTTFSEGEPMSDSTSATEVQTVPAAATGPTPEDLKVLEDNLKQQAEALKAKETTLLLRELALAKAEYTEFAERLVKDGRLLPVHTSGVVEFMATLKSSNAQDVTFAEGDETKTLPGMAWFKSFLETLPKAVTFTEVATGQPAQDEVVDFVAPSGFEVTPQAMEEYRAVETYARLNKVDTMTALRAIAGGKNA